jgi:uncharacterized protein YxjI
MRGLRRRQDDGRIQFRMREKLLSIGDDYVIEDDEGVPRYRVNGKAFRFRDTWVLEDPDGREVARIREKKLSIRDAITIEIGDREAKVKKALVGIRDRFHVDIDGEEDLKIHGNIVDHEYQIDRGGHTIAEVSKRWFRVRDTYGVEVYEPADATLILAATVAVDALAHD